MRAKLFILVLLLLPAVAFTGCGESSEKNIKVDYEVVEDPGTLPAALLEKLEELQHQRGYFFFDPGEYETGKDCYLLVFAGEKKTGGYTVSLESLTVENETLKIIVEEKEPAEGQPVIQVLTYPLLAVNLGDFQPETIKVLDSAGREYKEINPQEVPVIQESGVFQGQIDSHSMEIEIDGQPQAFAFPPDLEWVLAELLNKGDEVVFSYYVGQDGRAVLTALDTRERAAMVRGVEGTLLGLIDANSVELKVDGEVKTFTLAEQINLQGFQEGESIVFDYYEDRHGQLIINRMEKAEGQ